MITVEVTNITIIIRKCEAIILAIIIIMLLFDV